MCEIFKSSYIEEQLQTTASELKKGFDRSTYHK